MQRHRRFRRERQRASAVQMLFTHVVDLVHFSSVMKVRFRRIPGCAAQSVRKLQCPIPCDHATLITNVVHRTSEQFPFRHSRAFSHLPRKRGPLSPPGPGEGPLLCVRGCPSDTTLHYWTSDYSVAYPRFSNRGLNQLRNLSRKESLFSLVRPIIWLASQSTIQTEGSVTKAFWTLQLCLRNCQ
jgi:hypothetical protein